MEINTQYFIYKKKLFIFFFFFFFLEFNLINISEKVNICKRNNNKELCFGYLEKKKF